jgi:hypothetical protein
MKIDMRLQNSSLCRRGQSLAMKSIILYSSIVGILTAVAQAQNETVTWQSPVAISGASDVSTNGTFFGSWAPCDGGANSLPVNGVVFQGYSSLPGFSTGGFDNCYGSYNDPGTTNANYNALLEYARYDDTGNGSGDSITWSDTPGHTYLIQIWANDGRGNSRTETFTGGANTSATVDFGDAPGQYIIGTYVADGSGSETITVSGADSPNGDYPQINLLQIRDVTVAEVTNYQSAVLADNPLAYYALNPGSDPSGVSPDLSGNGNDGNAYEITPATGPTPYITNAANFVAGNFSFDDLSEGSNPGLLDFSGPITLEAWAQPSSTSEFGDIVAKGYDSMTYDEITIRVNGPYGADYYASSGSVGDTGGPQTTQWTYVVMSSDGVSNRLYINGALVVQNSDVNGSVNFTDDWVIGDGSSDGDARFFDGNISEVAIYNYGLSAAQVQAHFYYAMAGTNNLNYAVPIITNQPQSQAVYPGSTVTFSAGVLSALPTTNQWFSNSIAISGQTNASLTLDDVQSGDAADYSMVVGNANGITTSTAASLTILPPGALQWSPNNNSGIWDTDTSANWIDLANDQPTVFNTGEDVLFDDTVGVPTTVTVNGTVSPGMITVDSSTNAFSIGSGTISGSGALIKEGSSPLTIDSGGSFTGPVTISGGSIYAGNNCFDFVSSITITNDSTLDLAGGTLSGNKPLTVSGTGVNGEGAVYNSYADYPQETVNVTLAGDSKFAGSARFDLASGAQINGPYNLTLDWSAGAGYSQWNSASIGADVLSVLVTNGSTLGFSYMDTSCQNPATLFNIGPSCQLVLYNGGFNGSFETAGTVTIYNGNLTFGGSTIHVLSPGIVYVYGSGDTFTGSSLIFENNCQWESYYTSGANTISNAVTFNGIAHFVIGDHNMVYTGVASGPGGFVADYYNSEVVFSASNTYTGPTIIGSSGNSPEVALTGNGSISDSTLIFFGGTNADVAHVDVSGRTDQTFTLASGQTLAGIGGINGSLVVSSGATISPAGTNTTIGITTGANSVGAIGASSSIALDGTTVIKLDGSGTNDQVESAAGITYGGTLSLLNISGSPLAAGNSFQIFSAPSYSGSFAGITPSTPGSGLAWDTSQLSSGVVGVMSVSPALPAINTVAASAGNLVFSGTNGTASATYYVLTTTNLATPLTNWVAILTNSFDANGNFSVTNAIDLSTPQLFYLIQVP